MGGSIEISRFGNLTLENTTFLNSSAYFGGTLSLRNQQGAVRIANVRVAQSAAVSAGVFYAKNTENAITVLNCSFEDVSTQNGGVFSVVGTLGGVSAQLDVRDVLFARITVNEGRGSLFAVERIARVNLSSLQLEALALGSVVSIIDVSSLSLRGITITDLSSQQVGALL